MICYRFIQPPQNDHTHWIEYIEIIILLYFTQTKQPITCHLHIIDGVYMNVDDVLLLTGWVYKMLDFSLIQT